MPTFKVNEIANPIYTEQPVPRVSGCIYRADVINVKVGEAEFYKDHCYLSISYELSPQIVEQLKKLDEILHRAHPDRSRFNAPVGAIYQSYGDNNIITKRSKTVSDRWSIKGWNKAKQKQEGELRALNLEEKYADLDLVNEVIEAELLEWVSSINRGIESYTKDRVSDVVECLRKGNLSPYHQGMFNFQYYYIKPILEKGVRYPRS